MTAYHKALLYNGDSNAAPMIGHYCSSSIPSSQISSTNNVLINFQSDGSVPYTGFQQQYGRLKDIGDLDNFWEFIGVIHSSFGSRCPFDLLSEMWHYSDPENGWTNAGANEIIVSCL